MTEVIKKLKYIIGGGFLLVALFVIFTLGVGMFNSYMVFSVQNIITDLLILGGSCLIGMLLIVSSIENNKYKYKVTYYGVVLIGVAYFLALIITLLSSSSMLRHNPLMERVNYDYNIIPFKTIGTFFSKLRHSEINKDIVISNLVGNFIMFMPLSFFIPILFYKKNIGTKVIVSSVCIIICFEILQMVFQAGSFDIDDIILNTAGVVAGHAIYKLNRIQSILKKLYIIPKEIIKS